MQEKIERLERVRRMWLLLVWSPWLWATVPLFVSSRVPSWSIPPRHFNLVTDIGFAVFGVLLFGSFAAAVAMSSASGKIELACRQALDAGELAWRPGQAARTRRGTGIQVRSRSAGQALVIRQSAPKLVRWFLHSFVLSFLVCLVVDLIQSPPTSMSTVFLLLFAISFLAAIFGPVWVLATWTRVTRICRTASGFQVLRRSGPWLFGPLRGPTEVVASPCWIEINAGCATLVGDGGSPLIVRLPATAYGLWQGLRLRGELEEALGPDLTTTRLEAEAIP